MFMARRVCKRDRRSRFPGVRVIRGSGIDSKRIAPEHVVKMVGIPEGIYQVSSQRRAARPTQAY